MKSLITAPLRFAWKWAQIIALAGQLFVLRPSWVFMLSEEELEARKIAPPIMWRVRSRTAFVTMSGSLVPFLIFILSRRFRFVTMWSEICLVVLILSMAPATRFLARWACRRYEHGVQHDDYQRCLECGYALQGLPERHVCPECGTNYDILDVKRRWVAYFRTVHKL